MKCILNHFSHRSCSRLSSSSSFFFFSASSRSLSCRISFSRSWARCLIVDSARCFVRSKSTWHTKKRAKFGSSRRADWVIKGVPRLRWMLLSSFPCWQLFLTRYSVFFSSHNNFHLFHDTLLNLSLPLCLKNQTTLILSLKSKPDLTCEVFKLRS